ncbi:hypothetical protein C8Q80DRAFT_1123506 [Daedaleopsis nitida]|nr:hypothetical protein C8Q80DRAFT_1123506 [Daedaleopsis nitida]
MVKFAVLNTVALACAVAVQGASLEARRCPSPDDVLPICETSLGSPKLSDCQEAVNQLGDGSTQGWCKQSNNYGSSKCQTVVRYRSCKIDVCGDPDVALEDGISCGGYLQTVLNHCNWNGLVGGTISPKYCNVKGGNYNEYRLQFSHS